MRVRPMVHGDVDRILAMTAAVSAHEGLPMPAVTGAALSRYALGAEPLLSIFVAETESAVIGHAAVSRSFDFQTGRPAWWLADLYVEPEHRRSGVGRQLLGAVARAALADDAAHLQWLLAPDNTIAVRFYESLGAREDSGKAFFFSEAQLRAMLEQELRARPAN